MMDGIQVGNLLQERSQASRHIASYGVVTYSWPVFGRTKITVAAPGLVTRF